MKNRGFRLVLVAVLVLWAITCGSYAMEGFIGIKDGYFYNKETGEAWVPHGIAYQTWNRPLGVWQTQEQIEYDLDEMVKMGANSVRIDMVWQHVEEDGDNMFKWENYDYFVQACEERDLRIFALIGYQWPPNWFPDEWYTMHPPETDAEGIYHDERWMSDIINYEHPEARAQYAEWLGAVAGHFEDSKAIVGWIVGNESGYLGLWSGLLDGYDPESEQAFRDWCEAKYGTIAAVNAAWGKDFADFDSIVFVEQYRAYGPDGAEWADMVQWREDSIATFTAIGAVGAKQADTNHLISYSTVGMQWGEEDWRYHAEDRGKITVECLASNAPIDFFSVNNYPWSVLGHESQNGQWGISYTKKTANVPVLYSETGFTSSETMWPGMNIHRQGPLVRNSLWESLEAGAVGTHIFSWMDRPYITDREKGFGILYADRRAKPALWDSKEAFNLMDQVNIHDLLMASEDPEPDIAFLWTDANDSQYNRYECEMQQVAGALERLGFEPYFLNLQDLANGDYADYKLVILPRNMRVEDVVPGTTKTVLEFLEEDVIGAGVHVMAMADLPGMQDFHGNPRPEFEAEVDSLFGIDASNVGGFEAPQRRGEYVSSFWHLIEVDFNANSSINGYHSWPQLWKYSDEVEVTDGTLWATMDSGCNRGFEDSDSSPVKWDQSWGSATVLTGQSAALDGDNMLELMGDAGVWRDFGIVPFGRYTFSTYFRSTASDALRSGREAYVAIEWYDEDENLLGVSESARLQGATPGDGWVKYTVDATAPADAYTGRRIIRATGAGAGTVYADHYVRSPALVVKDHGTAKSAIFMFSVGDTRPDSDFDGDPDVVAWEWRYDMIGAVVKDYFGMEPPVEVTGDNAYLCLPEYRTCDDGSTLWQIKNYMYDTNFPATWGDLGGGAPQTFTISSPLFEGKTVEALGEARIVEQNCDGTITLTLDPDGMEMLHVYGEAAPMVPAQAWSALTQQTGTSWGNSGWAARNFRVLVKGDSIARSGSTCYLTLQGRSSGNYTAHRVSIVKRDGTTLNGVDSTYRQITFGGSWDAGALVTAGNTITSDPFEFDLEPGEDVFVTYWADSGEPTVYLTGGSEVTTWTVTGSDLTSTIDWEGISISGQNNNIYAANRIDVLAPQTVATDIIDIDFDEYSIVSYGGQDLTPAEYDVLDGGNEINLRSNTWKAIALPYTVTADTMISFDFRNGGVEGEIHGIGLDEDLGLSANRIFKIFGTQTWGLGTYDTYSGSDWQHFEIAVGAAYTGARQYLVFVNDCDVARADSTFFRNVKVYEAGAEPPPAVAQDLQIVRIADTPALVHPFGDKSYQLKVKYDCVGRDDLTLHVAFMEDGDNGDGTADEIYQELSAAVTGNGAYTDFWMWIPDFNSSDSDYVSTEDGGNYVFKAWLEDGDGAVVKESIPQATQLKWGVRPTEPLPTDLAKGDHLEIDVEWEELYEYLPWEVTPIARNEAFPNRVGIFRSHKTEDLYPGHFDTVNAVADWLETLGYEGGNPLVIDFDNLQVNDFSGGTLGAVLYSDNFQDGNANGWNRMAGCGNWTVEGGKLRASRVGNDDNMLQAAGQSFGDCVVQADVSYVEQGPYFNDLELYVRYIDRDNFVKIGIRNFFGFWRIMGVVKVDGYITCNKILHNFDKASRPVAGADYQFRVEIEGDDYTVFFDGVPTQDGLSVTNFPSGGGLAVGCKAPQLGIWEPRKGYYFIDDDEYSYWAPEGQPTPNYGTPLELNRGYLEGYFPTLILPGTYVMSDTEVDNVRAWIDGGLRCLIATDGGIAMKDETGVDDLGRIEDLFGVSPFVYQTFEDMTQLVIGPNDHYVTLDYNADDILPLNGDGHPWVTTTTGEALATAYNSGSQVPAVIVNTLDENPAVPKKVVTFNFDVTALGQMTNSMALLAQRAFEWAQGEAFKVTLQLKYDTGNPDLDPSVYTTTAWILSGSGETTLMVDLPENNIMTGDNLYWVMYVHPWDADDAWLEHSGFYSSKDDGLVVELDGQGLQLLGATDKAFAGRAWDVWVAYNTTGETVNATFGIKDQGPMEFEDTFSDGECLDWGLESSGNFSRSVTPDGAMLVEHLVSHGYSKIRRNMGSGILANNCTLEFDVMYLTTDATLSILYQDRGPYSSPGIPALYANADTTGIWHHVELHVYDGVYDYLVNGDVVRANYPLPGLNPNYRTHIGFFCFNGDFLIDNVRHVDEEYSVVPIELTGELMPTEPEQAFWASIPDYDPDKIDHNGTTEGSDYEWYVQFKNNAMEVRQDTDVFFAPRLIVEATNFPTTVQPGTIVDVPVDWEGLYGLTPANLRIELVEPINGITAASSDFVVTSPEGWNEYPMAIPADLRGSEAYLWVAYLYATNAVDPYDERIGLDDTYRFNKFGFPVQPETKITVAETLGDPYVVYDDLGLPMGAQVFTWGSSVTYDGQYADPTAPEGDISFYTDARNTSYGAGWGVFKGLDMSPYVTGSLCFWLNSSNTVKIELEGPQGTKRSVNLPSTAGVWVEYELALTNFAGVNFETMYGLFAINQGTAGKYYVDDIRWVGRDPLANAAPSVSAGMDSAVFYTNGTAHTMLFGAAADDGLPDGTLDVTWSKISGPGTVSFADATAQHTAVDFSATGTYVLRLTASDGVLSTSDDATFVVTSDPGVVNQAPTAYAGGDQITVVSSPLELSGFASDDGLPSGELYTSWTKISGPGIASFADSTVLETTVSFTEAGTYVLRLTAYDGQFSDTDDITVTVEDYIGTLIQNGQSITASIDAAGEIDNFVFYAEEGEAVKLRMGDRTGSSYFDLVMTLHDPVGEVMTSASGENNAEINAVAPMSGYYVVKCREADSTTGGYALSMLFMVPGAELHSSDADIGWIENGQSKLATINQAGDIDAVYFNAEAGDVVRARMGDRTGSSYFDLVMYLYGPDGTYITSASGENNADITHAVTTDGTYMLVCREADATTGAYALSIAWVDPGHALVGDEDIGEIFNGDSKTGAFDQSGDLDTAYFTAEAGDVVRLRMGDRTGSSYFDMYMYLYGPDGSLITSVGHENNPDITHTVTESGTYTVVMCEADATTGGYALSILWLDPGHALVNDTDIGEIQNGESIAGSFNQAGDLDFAYFDAAAGDVVRLRMGDRTGSSYFDMYMYVYGPNGEYISSSSGENNVDITVNVTESGTYTVVMCEADTTTGGYALSAVWLDAGHALTGDTDVGEIQNGETKLGTFNQSGDLDSAFFTAAAGDVIRLRMGDRTGSSYFDMYMYLYGPDGEYITSASGENNADITYAVTNSGTYTVVMCEADATTGNYALSLVWLDPGHALQTDTDIGEIQNGETKLASFNQSGDLDMAYYDAVAGDVVKLRMGDRTGSSYFDMYMYLYGPNGEYITSASGENNAEITHTVTNSGTYTVVMCEADATTGGYALSALWIDDNHALVTDTDIGTITSGQTINGTINQAGDLDGAFFVAQTGDVVTVTMGDRTGSSYFDMVMYLYDPDGNYITSASGESTASFTTTITNAGQHTIVMREADATTGGYNVALTLVPAVIPDVVTYVNFNDFTVQSYGGSQDGNSSQFEILDGGSTLHMWGNNWKAIANGYTITANTVMEYEFRSVGTQGEINGACYDADLSISADRLFQVYGTQTWGIQTYRDYTGTEWKKYTIPIGQQYTGAMTYMCFVNDADGGQATDVYYRNVRIYEAD